MAKKPDPNKPITHINPPTQVPDRVMPHKPGYNDTVVVPETEANPDKPKKPKKKPSK
jgi:hypothetical protein